MSAPPTEVYLATSTPMVFETKKVVRKPFTTPTSTHGAYYLWTEEDEQFYQRVCRASAQLWSHRSTNTDTDTNDNLMDEPVEPAEPDTKFPLTAATHDMAILMETQSRLESSMNVFSYLPYTEENFSVIYDLFRDYAKHDRRPPSSVLVLLVRGYFPSMHTAPTATQRRNWAKLTQVLLGRQWLTLENSVTLSRYWWWVEDCWPEILQKHVRGQITAMVRKQMREPAVQEDMFRYFGRHGRLGWVLQLETNETPPQKVYDS